MDASLHWSIRFLLVFHSLGLVRAYGTAFTDQPCAYCSNDEHFGSYYTIVTNKDEAPVPRVSMNKGARDVHDERTGQVIGTHDLLTVEFTARYWTNCPDTESKWTAHPVPMEWHKSAQQCEDNGAYGVGLWASQSGLLMVRSGRLLYARREAARCANPLPYEPVERQEEVRIEGIDVAEPYIIDRIALPPNPAADVFDLLKVYH